MGGLGRRTLRAAAAWFLRSQRVQWEEEREAGEKRGVREWDGDQRSWYDPRSPNSFLFGIYRSLPNPG